MWEGLGGDPVPGDADAVRVISSLFGDVHGRAELIASRLRGLNEGIGPQVWSGPAAEAFCGQLSGMTPDLDRLAASYGLARDALAGYAASLETAQHVARQADQDATGATVDHGRAAADRDAARADLARHSADARAAELRIDAARAAQLVQLISPDGYAAALQDERVNDAQCTYALELATVAKGRVAGADDALSAADARLAAARSLAADARQLRDSAGQAAVRKLDEASHAGIANRTFFEQAWQAGVDFVKSPGFQVFLNCLDDVGGLLSDIGLFALDWML